MEPDNMIQDQLCRSSEFTVVFPGESAPFVTNWDRDSSRWFVRELFIGLYLLCFGCQMRIAPRAQQVKAFNERVLTLGDCWTPSAHETASPLPFGVACGSVMATFAIRSTGVAPKQRQQSSLIFCFSHKKN
jgi:hypothetical protein